LQTGWKLGSDLGSSLFASSTSPFSKEKLLQKIYFLKFWQPDFFVRHFVSQAAIMGYMGEAYLPAK